jgi:hypothetical protein
MSVECHGTHRGRPPIGGTPARETATTLHGLVVPFEFRLEPLHLVLDLGELLLEMLDAKPAPFHGDIDACQLGPRFLHAVASAQPPVLLRQFDGSTPALRHTVLPLGGGTYDVERVFATDCPGCFSRLLLECRKWFFGRTGRSCDNLGLNRFSPARR